MIINTAQGGGGSDLRLKVYARPTEPAEKTGVWLKTALAEKIKKIVFDSNVWAAGQWQNPSQYGPLGSLSNSGGMSAYNGEIYSLGNPSFKYNPSTNTTTVLASHPDALSRVRQILVGNEIYCFGGYNGAYLGETTHCYKYSIANNTFTRIADYPAPSSRVISNMGLAYLDGSIYCFGGIYYSSQFYTANYCYKYDISANTFTSIKAYPNTTNDYGTTDCSAIVYNNKIYIFGGRWQNGSQGNGNNLKNYIYDPDNNSFTGIADSPMPLPARLLLGDKVLSSPTSSNAAYYTYDFGADSYTQLGTLPYNIGVQQARVGNVVFSFLPDSTDVRTYMLTAKQYPGSPSFIFYRLPKDTTFEASLASGKIIDEMPVYFKDCMWFKDGDITFPELYTGDGTQWNIARSAQ